MARTAGLVGLFSTVIGHRQKKEKKAENALKDVALGSRHITKLEKSIFFRYLWF